MKRNPIEEAKFRADNARLILKERGLLDEELNYYENQKFVRKSGRALWRAVLIALDTVFDIREDRRTKVYIEEYLDSAAKKDEKFAKLIDIGYYVIRVCMGYDGIQHKPICDEGFRLGEAIIDRCAAMLQNR